MNDEPAKAILAKHGKSFYWASFFLGKKLALSAAKLYQSVSYTHLTLPTKRIV